MQHWGPTKGPYSRAIPTRNLVEALLSFGRGAGGCSFEGNREARFRVQGLGFRGVSCRMVTYQ